MRAVVQRVTECHVSVDGKVRSAIGPGIVVLLGISTGDGQADCDYTAGKAANLRIFPDEAGTPNRSIVETNGEAMVISQFTLYGDTRKGRRPSYNEAAAPEVARPLYERFLELLRDYGLPVAEGEFGADMAVTYTNDGPFTVLIDSRKTF